MRMIALAALLFASVALFAGAQAQTPTLPLGTAKATVDGVVAAGEYATTATVGKMVVSLSRTADTLFGAITAETAGWAGLGFGALKMDKALIVIGFVAGGKAQVVLQRGTGRSHGNTDTGELLSSAATESDGKTTVEFSLTAAGLIASGQKELGVILAYGGSDNFNSPHRARSSLSVALQ